MGPLDRARWLRAPGHEGCIGAFRLEPDTAPIVVEAVSGRAMTLAPGDTFLATPGHRESTRWVVGGVPAGGLVPGATYWVLAECGAVGELTGDSPSAKRHLGRACYLGAAHAEEDGRALCLGDFAERAVPGASDAGAPVFLVVGTSAEVGKTTAGITVLRALRRKGAEVVAFKATGTSSVGELSLYRDFGAAWAFDCVDFGLPTTYPSGRPDAAGVFEASLDTCLALPADAVLIECGGDLLGANVPVFLERLTRRRPEPRVIVAAADALGAAGAARLLREMGLAVTLVTGPCTDTPTLRRRTEALCEAPTASMMRPGA